jgi:hypothetical protein
MTLTLRFIPAVYATTPQGCMLSTITAYQDYKYSVLVHPRVR